MSNSVHLRLCKYVCMSKNVTRLPTCCQRRKMLTQMTLNSRLNFNNKSWCGLGTGRLCEVSSDLRDQFEIFCYIQQSLIASPCLVRFYLTSGQGEGEGKGIILPQDRILQSISLGIEVSDLTMSVYGSFQRPQKAKKEMSQSSLIGHSVLALKYVWHSCKLAVRLGQKISAHALCQFRYHFFL